MSNTSETRLAYIAETAWGTTPTTPAFTNARFTSESILPNIDNTTSNEIRQDRNVSDLIQVGSSAGGSLDFELSYGSYDDFLESVMYNTWSTNVLKNGSTEKSFTFEKLFQPDAGDQYHRFAGAVIGGMTLNASVGSVVTGSFDISAKGITVGQAIITGATYTGANTNPVINAATDFASLSIGSVTGPELTNISLSVTNNLRNQQVLGSLDARAIAEGRFEVTGSLTAYFENEELYDLFLNGTGSSLEFKLGGASSKNYLFELPNIKFDSGDVSAGGNDQDLVAEMSFTALYDATEEATLKITRTA